jgi:hypothetical protein
MEQQSSGVLPRPFSVLLEIFPEDAQDADAAALHDVAQQTLADLRKQGFTSIDPMYTGQRGGIDLIFQLIFTTMHTLSTDVLVQKDFLDVLAALCTIFVTIKPVLSALFRTHTKQETQESAIKVFVKVDHAEIEVTSSDVANDERIVHLAERFLAEHPTARVQQQAKVHIRRSVPRSKPRSRR